MLSAYVTGPYEARDELRAAAHDLRVVGYTVPGSWLDDDPATTPGDLGAAPSLTDEQVDELGAADFGALIAADVLVVFTAAAALSPAVRAAATAAACDRLRAGALATYDEALGHLPGACGARHVETGYALALGVAVVLVGAPEHRFHRLSSVERHPDWRTALAALAGRLVEHTTAAQAVPTLWPPGRRR